MYTRERKGKAAGRGNNANRRAAEKTRQLRPAGRAVMLGNLNDRDVRVSDVVRGRAASGKSRTRRLSHDERDPDYVLDENEAAEVDAEDVKLEQQHQENARNSSENIPERLILRLSDDVCYGGKVKISRVLINMTGSREKDKRLAREQFEKKRRAVSIRGEAGYTWHHIPNYFIGSHDYSCYMVLVETNYPKSHRHKGAVWQYERASGKKYK